MEMQLVVAFVDENDALIELVEQVGVARLLELKVHHEETYSVLDQHDCQKNCQFFHLLSPLSKTLIILPEVTRLSHPLGPVVFRPPVTRGLVFSMVP